MTVTNSSEGSSRAAETTLRVGIYTRISEDVEGRGAGVRRQREDGEAICKVRRWAVAGVYEDNDVSAFKTNVVRPAFERLLTDVADGRIDGIVAYDLDRFVRQPVDLERAIAIYDRRHNQGRPAVFATVQADIDLQTTDGRTMARVMVAFANKSSMDTSRRVKRTHLDLARLGVPVGGHRPFGYKADKRTIEPSEAALIREAAAELLAGGTLHGLVRRWNDAGIRTTRGNPWQRIVVKKMLSSPRLAGFRVHQGRIATDAEGRPVLGQYPAVLDMETWEALCAVLADPGRGGGRSHPGGRKYLLSGIVRCGECRQPLRGNADTRYGTFRYACSAPANGGCGKVVIAGPALDEYVTGYVKEALEEYVADRDPASAWPDQDELGQVAASIEEIMAAVEAGELPSRVGFARVTELDRRREVLVGERDEWLRAQAVAQAVPEAPTQAWETLTMDRRRALVETVLVAVYVRRSSARGRRLFDESRVELVPRRG